MTLKLFIAELSALYNFGLSDEVLLLRTHKMFSVEMRKMSSILVKKMKKLGILYIISKEKQAP